MAVIFPLTSDHVNRYWPIAGAGLLLLIWISILNWLWLSKCAAHVRMIEQQMDEFAPDCVNWERTAAKLTIWTLLPPRKHGYSKDPEPKQDQPKQAVDNQRVGNE